MPIAVLAACNSGPVETADAYGPAQAREGAAIRAEVREIYGILNPVCGYTEDPDQLARYEAQRARYAQIKASVADTPRAVDFASVEADHDHYWAGVPVECGETDTPETLERLDADLADAQARLDTLARLTGAA